MLILEKRCRIHLIIIPSSRIIDLFCSSVVRKCVNSHALFHVFFYCLTNVEVAVVVIGLTIVWD